MNLIQIDEHEFVTLIEPYRQELHAHCYRLMGSMQDAEDMVQETFLRAWRKRESIELPQYLRAWLYKIATNICLDELKKQPQRVVPMTYQEVSLEVEHIPANVMEPIWLEPFPDRLLMNIEANPEGYFVAKETIHLAFVTALHLLPPRQRAILILRDVLEWPATEVATVLEITVSAVKSALHRARSTLARHYGRPQTSEVSAIALDENAQRQLREYVNAWEQADVEGLLRLLKEDATFSMPPIPSWYRGHDVIRRLISKTVFGGQAAGRWRLIPTRANRQIAFGLYRRSEVDGIYEAYGIQVLEFTGGGIVDIITFRNPPLFRFFDLPMIADQ